MPEFASLPDRITQQQSQLENGQSLGIAQQHSLSVNAQNLHASAPVTANANQVRAAAPGSAPPWMMSSAIDLPIPYGLVGRQDETSSIDGGELGAHQNQIEVSHDMLPTAAALLAEDIFGDSD